MTTVRRLLATLVLLIGAAVALAGLWPRVIATMHVYDVGEHARGLFSEVAADTSGLDARHRAASMSSRRFVYGDAAKHASGLPRPNEYRLAPQTIRNPVPGRVARVVDARVLDRGAARLGAPGADDAFVTAADDIAGLSSEAIAQRLTLLDNAGQLRSGPFAVLEFDTPAGIASPVFRKNLGFVGFGRTAGGAREFVTPNLSFDELLNLTVRRVP